MKTRIVHTKFWKDSRLRKISPESQRFFLYLITCEHIGLTGIFELPADIMTFEFRETARNIDKIKEELSLNEIVYFVNDWVVVKNATRHNNFQASPKTSIAFNREYDSIPLEVITFINDTGIDTSIYTLNNHKSKTINNKPETINHKTEDIKRMILDKYSVGKGM
jgi:hypothetical protein